MANRRGIGRSEFYPKMIIIKQYHYKCQNILIGAAQYYIYKWNIIISAKYHYKWSPLSKMGLGSNKIITITAISLYVISPPKHLKWTYITRNKAISSPQQLKHCSIVLFLRRSKCRETHTHFFKKMHFVKWRGTREVGFKWGGVKVRTQKWLTSCLMFNCQIDNFIY